jgi:hypothetical protein
MRSGSRYSRLGEGLVLGIIDERVDERCGQLSAERRVSLDVCEELGT